MTRRRPHSFDTRRAVVVKAIAAELLTAGVAELPLRDLAKRLATSDRMLLYYFDDKDELTRLAMQEIAAGFAVRFFAAVPMHGRQAPCALLHDCSAVLLSPTLAPSCKSGPTSMCGAGAAKSPISRWS